jgi:hypothetical protein
MKDPVTGQWFILVPDTDLPRFTKNIKCLKLSTLSKSKHKPRMGQVPINMGVTEDIWLKSGGASVWLQATKLTSNHFAKNTYSWMNVSLATQLLSASTTAMIQNSMDNNENLLNLCEKIMYGNICDLCTHWNSVVDICNRRDGLHSPENAATQQTNFCSL